MQDHPSSPAATPAPNALSYPGPASLPAKVAVIASIQSVVTDLADLATQPEPGEAGARVASRLAEETAEVAAMIRALPGRPHEMSGHGYAALEAFRSAIEAGEDIGEFIARVLATLATEIGGTVAVIANRPGSWEASLIADLLSGTVGPDDENLPMFGITS